VITSLNGGDDDAFTMASLFAGACGGDSIPHPHTLRAFSE
jgi:hypothetical protein